MSKSSIEWTTETWNPIVGCSILSPGCTNCYAMAMAARIEAMNLEARETERSSGKRKATATQYDGTTKKVNGHAIWTGKMAMAGDNILLAPLKRKKPTTYFVNSMGDLFHEDVPDEWIDKVFAVMALCPQHIFQVLTKRAKRMRDYLTAERTVARSDIRNHLAWNVTIEIMNQWFPDWKAEETDGPHRSRAIAAFTNWPLPNVWLGVSTERQQEANERIPLLLQTPAAIRFISAEPLLGPIELFNFGEGVLRGVAAIRSGGMSVSTPHEPAEGYDDSYPGLDWVIVGGESGSNARPMHPDWVRSLRNQCSIAGVPFFFKQWGSFVPIIDRDNEDPDWRRDYTRASNEPGKFKILNVDGGCGFHGERVHLMQRYGKKSAGRTLDGMIHNEMPDTENHNVEA